MTLSVLGDFMPLHSLFFSFFFLLFLCVEVSGSGGRLINTHKNRENAPPDNSYVEIRGRQLFVDGQPFFIKGVCYSPVPIGETPTYEPHGDYFSNQYAYIWKRDLPLLERMGATTLRLYGWDTTGKTDHTSFLNEVHKYGLKLLITYWLGTSTDTPVDTWEARQKVIDNFVKQIGLHGDHPAILMWSFGNELNGAWNGFMSQLGASYGCGYNLDCTYAALLTFINDAARAAKSVTSRPITSGFADLDQFVFTKVPAFEHLIPDLGSWALQLYRGHSFGSVFRDFLARSSKPILITEFGVDAFNDPCGWPENRAYWVCFNMYNRDFFGGDMPMPGQPFWGCQDKSQACAWPGVDVQAQWDYDLAVELLNEAPEKGGAVIGGFVMAWTDEFWKGAAVEAHCNFPCPWQESDRCRAEDIGFFTSGAAQCNEKAHFTCDNYDTTYHDLCGYFLYSAPDHYVNEEWFGITTPTSCGDMGPSGGYHLDALRVRPAYTALQRLWRNDGTYDHDVNMLVITCDMLRPCHHCLMKYLPEQIDEGACDALCDTFLTIAPPKPATPWRSGGFWADYGLLIIITLSILVAAVLSLLTIACAALKRKHARQRLQETSSLLS